MCKSYDDDYKVRGVFLYILKAFDKAWHLDLHYKLSQNGISDKFLSHYFF